MTAPVLSTQKAALQPDVGCDVRVWTLDISPGQSPGYYVASLSDENHHIFHHEDPLRQNLTVFPVVNYSVNMPSSGEETLGCYNPDVFNLQHLVWNTCGSERNNSPVFRSCYLQIPSYRGTRLFEFMAM